MLLSLGKAGLLRLLQSREARLLRLLRLREACLLRLLLLGTGESSLLGLLLLLLLLLLELRLELRGDRGHRRRAGLEALLRLGLAEASLLRLKPLTKAGRLRLETLAEARGLRLLLLCHARVAGVLLLERRLAETRGLRSKRTRLLLLLSRLLASHAEGASILLRAGTLAVAAQESVRVRIHGGRLGRRGRARRADS